MTSEERVTTIQIKVSTRDKLNAFGKKKETYDDVILRLFAIVNQKGIK